MNKKEYFTVNDSTMMKGIAILLMIFHHLFRLKEFSYGYDISFFPLSIGRVAQIATFFKICVPIFVFLSGYGLLFTYKKMKSKKNFFIKRYFKLMPLFWFTAFVSFILLQLFFKQTTNYYFSSNIYYGVTNILFDLLGINGLIGQPCFSNNWWYIGASLIFIFLLPILLNATKKYGPFNILIALIIIPRIFNISNVSTVSALPYIFVFYLGMLFQHYNLFKKVKSIKINMFLKFIIYIFTLLILYLIHTHYPRNIFWELHFGIIPVVFILFCYEFIFNIPLINKILLSLGKNSYVMFLIHGFFIDFTKDFIYSFKHMTLVFIVLTIISYLTSVIITRLFKLLKIDVLFSNIEKKYFN